jgi:hypothetical protein
MAYFLYLRIYSSLIRWYTYWYLQKFRTRGATCHNVFDGLVAAAEAKAVGCQDPWRQRGSAAATVELDHGRSTSVFRCLHEMLTERNRVASGRGVSGDKGELAQRSEPCKECIDLGL